MSNSTDSVSATPERMHCMEVWGGNREADHWFEMPGLDVRVYSRPYGESTSGGDVYYISSCASGRITRMLLADVSGHGAVVSDQAVGLLDLMRRNVNYIKQARFVRAMNRQFSKLDERGGFATALVVTYFAPTQSLTVSNAGHPPPLVFRTKDSSWRLLRHEAPASDQIMDTPLGVVDQAAYHQTETNLSSGDMLLCYSDALIESKGQDGEMFGTAGLLKLTQQLDMRHPELVIGNLVQAISSSRADNLDQDDATLLLLHATASKPRMKDNLLAPFRMFGPVANHTNLDFDESNATR